MNPYGAVPEALKDTRATLRDIMNDYVSSKTEESKVKVALATIAMQGEKERLLAEADIAKAGAVTRFQEAKLGQEATRIDIERNKQVEAARHGEALEGIAGTQAGTARKEFLLKKQKEDYLNEPKSVEDWAKLGLTRSQGQILKDLYGEGAILPRREIDEHKKLLKENPAMFYLIGIIGAKDQVDEIRNKLMDPNTPPEQRPTLEKNFNELLNKADTYNKMMQPITRLKKTLTPKDYEDMMKGAHNVWDVASDEYRAKFNNDFMKFREFYTSDYQKTVSATALNLEELMKMPGRPEKAKAVPEQGKALEAELKILQEKKGKAAANEAWKTITSQYLNKGDASGALEYLKKMGGVEESGAQKKTTAKSKVGRQWEAIGIRRKGLEEKAAKIEEEKNKQIADKLMKAHQTLQDVAEEYRYKGK